MKPTLTFYWNAVILAFLRPFFSNLETPTSGAPRSVCLRLVIHLRSSLDTDKRDRVKWVSGLFINSSGKWSSEKDNLIWSNDVKRKEHSDVIKFDNSYSTTNKMHLFLKLFNLVKRSTCFGRSFHPSSWAQNCTSATGICQTAAATCC